MITGKIQEVKSVGSSFGFQMNIVSLGDYFFWIKLYWQLCPNSSQCDQMAGRVLRFITLVSDSISKPSFLAAVLKLWQKVKWIAVVVMEKSQLKNNTVKKSILWKLRKPMLLGEKSQLEAEPVDGNPSGMRSWGLSNNNALLFAASWERSLAPTSCEGYRVNFSVSIICKFLVSLWTLLWHWDKMLWML